MIQLVTMFSDTSFFSTRTFVMTSAVALGTGLAIVLYQQRLLEQSQQKLLLEVRRLSQHVAKLEGKLKKATLAHSSSSEEIEEIFMDASESEPLMIKRNLERIPPEGGLNGLQNLEILFGEIDAQINDGGTDNLRNAHERLKHMLQNGTNNSQVFWRLSKCLFLLASEDALINPSNDGSAEQKELMKKAFEAAEMAVELDSACGDAYKWLAIVKGSITQYLPIQDQIKSAYEIKENILSSIKYNPNDSLSYHMLGRWCFSVYSLSWLERRIASTLFASPPTATLEEAMEAFMKAEELSPKDSIDNCLYLAKCYICKKDYEQAVYWLRAGAEIKGSSRDVRICSYTDQKSMEEIEALLKQYQSYVN